MNTSLFLIYMMSAHSVPPCSESGQTLLQSSHHNRLSYTHLALSSALLTFIVSFILSLYLKWPLISRILDMVQSPATEAGLNQGLLHHWYHSERGLKHFYFFIAGKLAEVLSIKVTAIQAKPLSYFANYSFFIQSNC